MTLLRVWACHVPVAIQFVNGQLVIENALHSYDPFLRSVGQTL